MAADQATVTTLEHGDASRLPDTSWGWRRLLIFMVTVWGMGMATWMAYAVYQIALSNAPPSQLVVLGIMGVTLRYGFYTAWGGLTLYGVAASVTDLAALAAAVRTTVRQTITSAPPPAVIQTPDSKVSTAADAGAGELPPDQRYHP